MTTTGRWTARAACAGYEPNDWFPVPEDAVTADVLDVCRSCPVNAECLEHAVRHHEHGIWAGTTTLERRGLRRGRPTRRILRPLEPPVRTAAPDSRGRVAACGTRPGYQRHLRNGERACEPCAEANRAYKRPTP